MPLFRRSSQGTGRKVAEGERGGASPPTKKAAEDKESRKAAAGAAAVAARELSSQKQQQDKGEEKVVVVEALPAAKIPAVDSGPVPCACWRADRTGAGVEVEPGERLMVARKATAGWGCQLAEGFVSKRLTEVVLAIDQAEGDAFYGVVGRNFSPGGWDTPFCGGSADQHCIGVQSGSGRVVYKGRETEMVLKPLTKGAQLRLLIDMERQALDMQLIEPSGKLSVSVTLEGETKLPPEVTVAVSLGPGSHAVRVVHVESRPSDDTRSICNTKDLWDPSNVVAPMGLDGRANGQSDAARQRRHEAFLASILGVPG
uniref:Uncharacterized protein n=1 Tax=Emiliania huxleyi TaxID=2903 RepID=A0A7S3SWS1_EMIHU|mmetsp:Transcript_39575/g.117527  ORF Transcript_39575/g.117527 Transcript_39575/m.117527 type:complete len:314 (+) Transcript_39575:44-985(+)